MSNPQSLWNDLQCNMQISCKDKTPHTWFPHQVVYTLCIYFLNTMYFYQKQSPRTDWWGWGFLFSFVSDVTIKIYFKKIFCSGTWYQLFPYSIQNDLVTYALYSQISKKWFSNLCSLLTNLKQAIIIITKCFQHK